MFFPDPSYNCRRFPGVLACPNTFYRQNLEQSPNISILCVDIWIPLHCESRYGTAQFRLGEGDD